MTDNFGQECMKLDELLAVNGRWFSLSDQALAALEAARQSNDWALVVHERYSQMATVCGQWPAPLSADLKWSEK